MCFVQQNGALQRDLSELQRRSAAIDAVCTASRRAAARRCI
jgi:hypothetical protein